MTAPRREMTPRQRRFVKEYAVDCSATKAAERSGFSKTSAGWLGYQLLQKPLVKAAVAKELLKRGKRTEITQDRVLLETGLLAFSDISHYRLNSNGDIEPTETAPEGAMRAISSIKKKTLVSKDGDVNYEVEFKLWNKPDPLKLAGKHVGLFADKVTVDGEIGLGLNLDALDKRERSLLHKILATKREE